MNILNLLIKKALHEAVLKQPHLKLMFYKFCYFFNKTLNCNKIIHN